MRLIPRAAVFKARVINLAQRRAVIAVGLEVLRERDRVGQSDSKVRLQIPNLRRIGPPTGEQRRPRRTAHRLLHISSIEDHAPRRQPIHVRRLHDLVAVAAEFRTQIIDRDEQHVGSLGVRFVGTKR